MKKVTFNLLRFSFLTGVVVMSLLTTSCKKDDETVIDEEEEEETFRGTKIKYSDLTSTTPYNNEFFVDENGDSTVDRTDGHSRLQMIRAIDAYAKTSANLGTANLSAVTFNNMFINSGSPFTGSWTFLNDDEVNVREATAASKAISIRDQVLDQFAAYFISIQQASLSVTVEGERHVAGKLWVPVTAPATPTTGYLVDTLGIEVGQVIAKSLIGSFQLDYICNVLLSEDNGLNADNTELVEGTNHTALERNWDVAYGILTLKPRYAQNATETPTASSGGESFLGSYAWEYNKPGYPQLHLAFLKGRAAAVNNDRAEMKKQAKIIREILEETIARAALGYLTKSISGASDAARAHAFGEGLGFIYSLRFCTLNDSDEAFSESILDIVEPYTAGKGYWDLTPTKTTTAADAIEAKFGF